MISRAPLAPSEKSREVEFQSLKTDIHRELIESLDLAAVGVADSDWVRREVRELSEQSLTRRKIKDVELRRRLLDELQCEVFGLGPLEPLM
ncbi:MAG TPA: CpaF family protein, partial [Pirellulaceae bacterium]|nr:CpaF family protein [Pirellulaceae bacterium]